jgi:hypothetical protein
MSDILKILYKTLKNGKKLTKKFEEYSRNCVNMWKDFTFANKKIQDKTLLEASVK